MSTELVSYRAPILESVSYIFELRTQQHWDARIKYSWEIPI